MAMLGKQPQRQLLLTHNDPSVGIKIVPVSTIGGVGTYATSIDPGKFVNPHFHPRGDEKYQIMSGNGEIRLLTTTEASVGREVPDSTPVRAGDSFTISEGCMHQLVNTGTENLVLIFQCTADHLTTENRVLTPNWKPPAPTSPACTS